VGQNVFFGTIKRESVMIFCVVGREQIVFGVTIKRDSVMIFCVVRMEQTVFGGTIIARHCNDILCCVNGADCVWSYINRETI